ncbi:hypothetical protein [Pararhodobacter aggregans]
MTRIDRPLLTATTALATLMLPLASGVALAQEAGFAVELSPATDPFLRQRIGLHVFGPVSEPASSFVRGCLGVVPAENAGAAFEVMAPMDTLSFTGAGAGLQSLVLGTPDGLYRCALADDQGFVSTSLGHVAPGRYTVWLGAAEGSSIDARLFASENPVSAIELFGLDVARLGEPRAGRFAFAPSPDSARQTLVSGAPLYAEEELRPLAQDNCWGYSRLDAADAILTLDQASDRFSVFAISERDLVMAVIDPAGQVHCNDDTMNLNPAVTFDAAQPGEYQVFVGGYSPGPGSVYDLFASAGMPAFSDAVVNLDAEPRSGHVAFDADQALQGQLLASAPVSSRDPVESLPIGMYCAGFTDISAPDLVLSLDGAQSMMSIYARSETDLVLAVRAPDGSWSCNDDAFQLNPGISFNAAQPGDYLVYVGSYAPGAGGTYNLYASMGEPNWNATALAGGQTAPSTLNVTAEPSVARLSFGPDTRIDPRVIFDITPSQTEAFGMGDGCAGYITPGQPDLVIDAAEGLPQLMVYMVADTDGTLTVVAPDGRIYCNDDFEQLNPGVMIPNPQAGAYAVFAGSYAGAGGMATLGVTIASPQWVMDREH